MSSCELSLVHERIQSSEFMRALMKSLSLLNFLPGLFSQGSQGPRC